MLFFHPSLYPTPAGWHGRFALLPRQVYGTFLANSKPELYVTSLKCIRRVISVDLLI